jgi:hypothetical protein
VTRRSSEKKKERREKKDRGKEKIEVKRRKK